MRASAAAASTRPEATQPPPIRVAPLVMSFLIWSAVGRGVAEARRLATPDTNGVADDVPQNQSTVPVRCCATLHPGAATSTQSEPKLDHGYRPSVLVAAPTA